MKWHSEQIAGMVSAIQKDMNGSPCTMDGSIIGTAILTGAGYITYGLLRIAEAMEDKPK